MKIDRSIYNYVWAYVPEPILRSSGAPKKTGEKNRRVEPSSEADDKPDDSRHKGKRLSIKV